MLGGMNPSIPSEIRRRCELVCGQARFVRILADRIPAYAASLPMHTVENPSIDREAHYIADDAGTLAFFVTLNAINFGSGFFPHLAKRPGRSGYYTVAMSLRDRFQETGPIAAAELASITPAQCTRLFGQDPANAQAAPLMEWFARALGDLGRLLIDRFQGRFEALVESAGHSALKLIEKLAQMPLFQDVSDYRGLKVPFYKRAQITSADLSIALSGRGLGRFTDLEQLTIFADNLVPHVLRVDGVLEYDPGLAARIDREELIAPNSEEEVEIRAAAVHAAELIVACLKKSGVDASAGKVDYLLWRRGGQPHYKTIKPRHRSRTVYY